MNGKQLPLAPEAVAEVLLDEQSIAKRVAALGAQISADFSGRPLVLVGILKGAFVFMADLLRHLRGQLEVDFMSVASYGGGTSSSGQVRVIQDVGIGLPGKDVLIVEDIIDSGRTLAYLHNLMQSRQVASLKTVTLLDKPARRTEDIELDYVGFTIADEYVVGYGLDFAQHYRELPCIATLRPDVLSVGGR